MATDPLPSLAPPTALLAQLDAAPLHAWGVVRNDALCRDPEARAAMLGQIGIRRVAIDWRYAQLETLDDELSALRNQKIAVSAIWAPISLFPVNDGHLDLLLGFVERNALEISLWTTLMQPHDIDEWVESKRVDLTCEAVTRLADRAARLGCPVLLYNYDGWFARPSSLKKIVMAANRPNVGIVYNFHHARSDIDGFEAHAASLLPWLRAVNLGGVATASAHPIAFGEGEYEFRMLTTLLKAGYHGALGLASFDAKLDASEALARGFDGLNKFRQSLAQGGA